MDKNYGPIPKTGTMVLYNQKRTFYLLWKKTIVIHQNNEICWTNIAIELWYIIGKNIVLYWKLWYFDLLWKNCSTMGDNMVI